MIQIKIRLFGAFRNYGNGESIELEVPRNSSVEDVKDFFSKKLHSLHPDFHNTGLILDSVLASEDEVLDARSRLVSSCSLAILPPVCGG